MKHTSLFARIYISFVVFLVIRVIVLGLVFRSGLLRSYQHEVTSSRLARLEAIRDSTDDLLSDVRRAALELSFSPTLDHLQRIGTSISGANVDHVFAVLDVLSSLSATASAEPRIESVYLYSSQVDAFFTSGREFDKRAAFRDTEWLTLLDSRVRLPFWVGLRVPVDPERRAIVPPPYVSPVSERPVITLVFPLSSYASSLDGALAVNVALDDFASTLANDDPDTDGHTYIYDTSLDSVLDMSNGGSVPEGVARFRIQDTLDIAGESGYVLGFGKPSRDIVFFAKSQATDWVYFEFNDYRTFYGNVRAMTTLVLVVSGLLVIGGAGVSYAVSRRLYNPVRLLVDDIRRRSGVDVESTASDMTVIAQAFANLRQQEHALTGVVERSRRKLREHLIMLLLRGTDNGDDFADVGLSFPHPSFLCAIAAIDGYASFERETPPERRYYLRELVIKIAGEVIEPSIPWIGLHYDNEKLAFVFNIPAHEQEDYADRLAPSFRAIQAESKRSLGIGLTFGVGGVAAERDGIEHSFLEAMEALKRRLVFGSGSVIEYRSCVEGSAAVGDPSVETTRIFNSLRLGDEARTFKEVDDFFATLAAGPADYYEAVQAINLLHSTRRTLPDIASAIGYNNDQSFARFFRKYEGITPGEYRRIRSATPEGG